MVETTENGFCALMQNGFRQLRLSGEQGDHEARTESYKKYDERVLEWATKLSAKSASGAASKARRQVSTTQSSKKPFAVFDIDGTLLRWQLYHATADSLVKSGHINLDNFATAKEARMTWKNRVSDDSFDDYQRALVKVYDQAITDISYEDYLAAAEKTFQEYKHQTYTYTRDLIKKLKQQGYLLFAVSGSQIEIVEVMAKHYGFDGWAASHYEKKDGKFTGNKEILFGANKPQALKELIAKYNASFAGSVGVGDTHGDIHMLEIVDQPIAFNPNKKLFHHAKEQGWKIAVERKNMVYELEPESGKYILA